MLVLTIACECVDLRLHVFSLASAARFVAMCGVTAALGSGELALMLSYAAARKVLPAEVRTVSAKHKHMMLHPFPPPPLPIVTGVPFVRTPSPPPTATTTSSNNDATTATSPPALSSLAPSSSSSSNPGPDRTVTLDPLLARRLLHAAVRLKRLWARTLLRIYSLNLEFEDRNLVPPATAIDPDPCVGRGPYLFVHLNQSCLLESAAFPGSPAPFFPPHFLMNYEFTLLPFLGWNLWLSGVTIDRASKPSARQGVHEVVRIMREEGRSVYMSIEGRRSETGALGTFKNGAALIAIQSHATIIPVISKGLRDALPFGQWRVRPANIKLIYERSTCDTTHTHTQRSHVRMHATTLCCFAHCS